MQTIAKNHNIKAIRRNYSKACLKWPLKKSTKIGFQYQLLLNASQKYCRMLQREHSAILSTCIKLPFVFKTFVLSIFKWPLKTGFAVNSQIPQKSFHCFEREMVFSQENQGPLTQGYKTHRCKLICRIQFL